MKLVADGRRQSDSKTYMNTVIEESSLLKKEL
jgi:hypothetical protein